MSTLEQRIAQALSDSAVMSTALAQLIAETETAILAADAAAEAERAKALDPLLSPDADAARNTLQAAEFNRERLRTVLPRLEERFEEAKAQEYAAEWESEYERVRAARDELAAELSDRYPKLVGDLAGLMQRMCATDQEIASLNKAAPPSEERRLLGTELTARDLDCFSHPPITEELKLPAWEGGPPLWPVWRNPYAAYAAVVAPSFDPLSSQQWESALNERERLRHEERERAIEAHKALAKERQNRNRRGR